MCTRSTKSYLEDILNNADAIADFLKDASYSTYQTNLKTRSAVERQLQNLTEAAFRLGADAAILCPGVDWRSIRGLGNVLRHEYDEIQDEIIWQAIHDRLPELRAAVQYALVNLTSTGREEP